MSSWIHINGVIRIDSIWESIENTIEKIRKKIKIIGLPKGSEGPLSYKILKANKEVQLVVYGNLRDLNMCDVPEITEKIIRYTTDLDIRQGFIQANCNDEFLYFVYDVCGSWKIIKNK